jgi:hypothetical protein
MEVTIQRKPRRWSELFRECMNPFNRKWYNFNDDFVRETVVSDKTCNSKGSSSPYVLFYIKTSCLNSI